MWKIILKYPGTFQYTFAVPTTKLQRTSETLSFQIALAAAWAMTEFRLTIRGNDRWLNISIVLFLMVKTIMYAANPMHSDILNWMIIFKIFNLSWHVS